jgi:signal peptidase II
MSDPGTKARLYGFGTAALVFALDQAVKAWLLGPLALAEIGRIYLVPIFNLTFTENTGVSLGLLTANSDSQRWLLVALTAAIALAVLVWMLRERVVGDVIALGLVLGGALGNITDRSIRGYVVDYADLHFGEYRPFLIFNLADAAITIGVLLVLARSFLSREKRPTSANTAPETQDA